MFTDKKRDGQREEERMEEQVERGGQKYTENRRRRYIYMY